MIAIKKEFRAHPLMALKFIKPLLFILLLPFFKAFLQYIVKDEIIGVAGTEILLICGIIIYSLARSFSFKLVCFDDRIIIENGVFFKKRADIPLSKISSVQNVMTPFDMLFRTMTYRINTEAGFKNRSDFEFKLRYRDGLALSEILYGGKSVAKQRFSAFRVAIMAAATSSAFTGMIIGVPIINKAGDLLGLALRDMLLNEINNVSEKVGHIFPPIVNVVSLIFLIFYFIAFVYSFLKYVNFRLRLSEDRLEVRSGIYERLRTSFKKASVNNVLIEQSAVMLFIKQYAMKVSVGGFGETKGESQMVVPCGKRSEIKQDFDTYFPFLVPDGNIVKTLKDKISRRRFLILPSIYFFIVLGISLTLALIFKDFGKLILFLSTVQMVIVFYYAYLSLFEAHYGQIRLGNTVFARSIKGLRTRELYCPKENIGQITLREFPLDRQFGTCSIKLVVRSESADSIRLRMMDYETIKKELNNCFNLEK